jgi:HlyD family secretion protein/macrolide-specific efflux system membrane fusion protein
MRRLKWIVPLVIVVGVAVVVVVSRGGEKPIDASLVVTAQKKDLALAVTDTGRVEPGEKVDIKSRIAGQVESVFVDEGDRVEKGQLLLKLDTIDITREVARAEAEVAQARQRILFAEATLARRNQGLAERAVARADVEVAENEVAMQKAQLRLTEVALAAARDRLRSCEIRSPMTGTVTARGIEPGEVVTPGVQATFEGKPLMTIADLSALIVRVELNQIDVARTAIGQKATLTLDALPGRSFDAVVTKVAPAAIKAEGRETFVFPIEATLDTGAGIDLAGVKPGMNADVRVLIETLKDVIAVPIEVVLKEAGKSYVTKVTGAISEAPVDGGAVAVAGQGGEIAAATLQPAAASAAASGETKTEKVEVTLGKSNDREIVIEKGVSAGDRLLINPASSKDSEANI